MFGRRKNKAWLVAVDMGYGHQRAALPLKSIAHKGEIITANNYAGIPQSDKRVWEESRRFYEIVSRFKEFPVLGDVVFALFDKFQEIKPFYPNEESIETPTLQVKHLYGLMRNKAWGRHLIHKLNKKPLPFITTFFIPAFMAEFWGYEGRIYVVVPDTDVSRAWAPLVPSQSKIMYAASTERAAARLARYGVKKEHIVQTGFPLPEEFTGHNAARAKKDLRRRLKVLDPTRKYVGRYNRLVEQYLGRQSPTFFRSKSGFKRWPVRITFAIGGAGAQGELAERVAESLKPLLKQGAMEFHIMAGVHGELAAQLKRTAGDNVFVHASANKKEYFRDFSDILGKTDILWTKPSELVFYAALGVPLILAPAIGSQEKMNRRWLLDVGAGVDQKKPELAHQWLPDLIAQGALAEAAMQGFIEIPKDGAEKIKKLVCG